MEVTMYNDSRLYAEVTEEAIERLRVPDDLRIPGIPESVENIARQCSLFDYSEQPRLLQC